MRRITNINQKWKFVNSKNATIETIERISKALDLPLSKLFEKLGGSKEEKDIALECYDFISSKSRDEQEQIYKILLEMDKYKGN